MFWEVAEGVISSLDRSAWIENELQHSYLEAMNEAQQECLPHREKAFEESIGRCDKV